MNLKFFIPSKNPKKNQKFQKITFLMTCNHTLLCCMRMLNRYCGWNLCVTFQEKKNQKIFNKTKKSPYRDIPIGKKIFFFWKKNTPIVDGKGTDFFGKRQKHQNFFFIFHFPMLLCSYLWTIKKPQKKQHLNSTMFAKRFTGNVQFPLPDICGCVEISRERHPLVPITR